MTNPSHTMKMRVFGPTKKTLPRYVRIGIDCTKSDSATNLAKDQAKRDVQLELIEPPSWVKFEHHIKLNSETTSLGVIGFCIYCGEPSALPGLQGRPTDEHVIPEGMGGNLVLEHASCQKCASIINSFETPLQLSLLLEARRTIGIKGKKRVRKDTHFITSQSDGKDVKIEVPLAYHPSFLTLPLLMPPAYISTRSSSESGCWGIFATQCNPIDMFSNEYANIFQTPGLDTLRFCQLLAKIAFAYEASFSSIKSFSMDRKPEIREGQVDLTHLILKTFSRLEFDTTCFNYIGQVDGYYKKSEHLHSIGRATIRQGSLETDEVFIRLFGNFGAPIYRVIVAMRFLQVSC